MTVQEGTLNEEEFESAMEDLDRHSDDMVHRLDGTYRLPERKEQP
jgi:hypothetical protein